MVVYLCPCFDNLSHRKAALLAALGGPSRLKKRVSAGTRAGSNDEVVFYTFDRFP